MTTTTSPHPSSAPSQPPLRRPATAFRQRIADHPVAAFLALLFAFSYPLMIPLALGRVPSPLARLGVDTEEFISLIAVAGALLPATLLVTAAADGRNGVRALLARAFRWRFGAGWWLLSLAGLPVLSVAFALLLGAQPGHPDLLPLVAGQAGGLVVSLLLLNLWEETAWAGFLQTRLERRHGIVVAALLTAVPFALFHLPLQLLGDDVSPGSLAVWFVLMLVLGSVFRLLIGLFLRGAAGSVLAVALLHNVFNRSNNSDGLVARLVPGPERGLAAMLALAAMTAGVALVLRRRGRRERTAGPRRATLRRFAVDHPVAAYLALSFTVAWAVLFPLVIADLPVEPGLLVLVFLGQLGPAALVTAAADGRAGVRELLSRTFRWRVRPAGNAFALLAMPLAVVLGAVLAHGATPLGTLLTSPGVVAGYLLALTIVPIINLWEETGWMFVQTRLEQGHGALRGAAITGVLFAALHIPLYLTTPRTRDALVALALALVTSLPFRIVIGRLYRFSGASVLVVALFHGSFNAVNSADVSGALLPGLEPAVVAAAAVAALAVAVLAGRRREVGR